MALAGHRWEKDDIYRGYRCVALPIGGVESYQWCVGCNALVGDIEVRELYGNSSTDGPGFHAILDTIARGKGFEPIEAGTLAEWKLKSLLVIKMERV